MNFQNLPPIEKEDFYLDYAIKQAHEQAERLRTSLGGNDKFRKSERIELIKVETLGKVLQEKCDAILTSFPDLESLPHFYLERRSYYGRINSFLKKNKEAFTYLERCRKIMKGFPHIKTSLKTVCIIGFPNVGKTTLFYKLTGSKPEIQSYAFTTKGINVGYISKTDFAKSTSNESTSKDTKKSKKEDTIQVLDTPGTLNRFDKMNMIEKQSYLAQKEVADMLIYVFDLTESSYPLEDQEKLYQETKKIEKPLLVYLSKTDLLSTENIKKFKLKHSSLQEIKDALLKDV
ncbi:50S ribosome-binding GTPase [Candidatus Woesearchaeota archaeon]|nr:50S ribosome-binding GTPase [Candidatus Woesearchaeota archaeon]